MVFSYIFAGINPKTREILAKYWQIQSNFPKTQEIWGKMYNILAKWLHYLWLFPNNWGILINLLHLCGDFSKNLENSCQNTHICSRWLNVGLFKIFSKTGSFIWWSMRIFQLFLMFAISDTLCMCFCILHFFSNPSRFLLSTTQNCKYLVFCWHLN